MNKSREQTGKIDDDNVEALDFPVELKTVKWTTNETDCQRWALNCSIEQFIHVFIKV